MAANVSKPLLVRTAPGRLISDGVKLCISQAPPGDGRGMQSPPYWSTSHICMSREARLLWVEDDDLEDTDPRFVEAMEEPFALEVPAALDLSLK